MTRRLSLLAILSVAIYSHPAGAQSCPSELQVAADRAEVWKLSQTVSIYVPPGFAECSSQIQQTASLWQNSYANRQFGVRFRVTTDPAATGTVLAVRDENPPSNPAWIGEWHPLADYGAQSAPGLVGAVMYIGRSPGDLLRFRAKLDTAKGSRVRKWAYDVFLVK